MKDLKKKKLIQRSKIRERSLNLFSYSPVGRGDPPIGPLHIAVRCPVSLRPGIGVPRDHPDLHILDGVRQNGEVNNGREEHVFGTFRDSRSDSWHLHQPS